MCRVTDRQGGLLTVTLRHCIRRKWIKRPVASTPINSRCWQGAEFAMSRVLVVVLDLPRPMRSV